MIKGFSLDIYDCDIAFAWDTNEKEINAYFDKAQVPDDYRKGFWENYGESKVGALTTFSCVSNAFTVFRDEPNSLSILIQASMPFRIQRVMRKQNLSESEARKTIEKVDKMRENYVQKYTNTSRYDTRNYDLIISADGKTEDEIVDIIMDYIG